MRILAVATALTVALLSGASVGIAADVGANDDSAKYQDDGGLAMYEEMAALGLEQTVIGVRFVPSQSVVIQDKELLDRAIASAQKAGLRVVLAVYPYPPRELEAGLSSPSVFASYVGVLASIYPEVKHFVIGNEPNQPAFWRPQFDASGRNASAPAFGPYLAAVERYGSPALDRAEVLADPAVAGRRVDAVLGGILDPQLEAASGIDSARCRLLRPGGAQADVGDGGVLLTATEAASLALRRFGDAPSVELGELPRSGSASLTIPTDEDPTPWRVGVIAGGPVRACSAT